MDNIIIGDVNTTRAAILVDNMEEQTITGPSSSVAIGTCYIEPKYSIGIGQNANSTVNYGIAIGTGAKCLHKNSIIIASNKETVCDNSVVIGNVMFVDGNISLGNLTIIDNDDSDENVCHGCLNIIKSGFKWFNDDSVNLYLCLTCIHSSVLHYRAKESWNENNGDPIKILQNRIFELENKIKEILEKIK
jgi:hypothetical protein